MQFLQNSNYKNYSSLKCILELGKNLPRKRQIQLILLLLITIFGTLVETLAVLTSVPYISYLTNQNDSNNSKFIDFIYTLFYSINIYDKLIILSIVFGLSIISTSIFRLYILKLNIRMSELIGLDIGTKIYKNSLYQPYIEHIKRSSTDLIDGTSIKVQESVAGINSFLQLISWTFIFSGVFISLILINYKIAIVSSLIFISIYFLISLTNSKKLLNNGKIITQRTADQIELVQNSFGGIRDIIIGKYQENYIKKYKTIEKLKRQKIAENNFITLSPKFTLEAIGFCFLISITLYLNAFYKTFEIIATLGSFAIGAQRLLPALQQIYANISKLKSYSAALNKVLDLLNEPINKYSNNINYRLDFKESIQLRNIYFKYNEYDDFILKNLNITIKKGECIGIKGKTGVGKSTVLDILMGLLEPTMGEYLIDGRNIYEKDSDYLNKWLNNISHVPQSIFLTNSTIAKNIAFEFDNKEIDYEKLKVIAKVCQLDDFINNQKYGYDTLVGERGIMLSGGQKQRIGIARALYRESELVFLDEATSALDNYTENKIMESIYKLKNNITIIMVAHRLSTLSSCDSIYELSNNDLKNT